MLVLRVPLSVVCARGSQFVTGGKPDLEPNAAATDAEQGLGRCSCVREGEAINVDVTAPGATLALGLIFLKSQNESVAALLALPDTRFALDRVRPELLLLRVVARSLILWDSVQPTAEWIEQLVPPFIRECVAAEAEGRPPPSRFGPRDGPPDVAAMRQAYHYVLAGGCMALGLRFAGSHSPLALRVLADNVRRFQRLRRTAAASGAGDRRRLDRHTVEVCLATCALALSVVMSGSGHLDSLRLLRSLRENSPEVRGPERHAVVVLRLRSRR